MHRAVAAVVATGRAAGGVASARAWCARAGLSTSSAAASTVTVGTPAGGPKLSTGIVGLDVVPNAKEVLIKLYEKTLNDLNIIPAGVPYRTEVEKFTAYRLAAVRAHDDVAAIEAAIGAGQVEELIEEAKGELILIPEYAAWKAWERKRPTPDDDDYADFYDELEVVDPESVEYLGLKGAAERKRAEVDASRKRAAANAAAAAAAAAAKAAAAAAAAPAAAGAAKP